MTVVWLIVWLIAGVPEVTFWNAWAVALGVCLFIDLVGSK